MLKILGSIIVILGASVIGFMYSGVYIERVRQIRDLQYALSMLETEIIYTATPLMEALLSIGDKGGTSAKLIFIRMSEMLDKKKSNSVYDAFKESYKGLKDELCICKEEVDVLESFMQSLGSSDIEGQKKIFNITIKKLEEIEKKAEVVRSKNERLYRYLGVCMGVLIVIILI